MLFWKTARERRRHNANNTSLLTGGVSVTTVLMAYHPLAGTILFYSMTLAGRHDCRLTVEAPTSHCLVEMPGQELANGLPSARCRLPGSPRRQDPAVDRPMFSPTLSLHDSWYMRNGGA